MTPLLNQANDPPASASPPSGGPVPASTAAASRVRVTRETASFHASPSQAQSTTPIPFGRPMRALFPFGQTYTPLNHGSYGTVPSSVLSARIAHIYACEERECIWLNRVYPDHLQAARAQVAPLMGCHPDEIALLTNATAGTNTVLRNLDFKDGDVVLYPETIYGACLRTLQSIAEQTPALSPVSFPARYPIEDDELIANFRTAVAEVRARGQNPRAAVIDVVVSIPGVRVPWEALVAACREEGVLSVIDGAHGIGHVDLRHTGGADAGANRDAGVEDGVRPDFLVSNLHKWLFLPRGCALLYVPFRNQHLIRTSLPTSHGYVPPGPARDALPKGKYLSELFLSTGTADNTAWFCVGEALRFRNEECGGEARIREYCERLALEGGDRVAERLGTEVLNNKTGSVRRCCFANVRLPLVVGAGADVEEGDVEAVAAWMYRRAAEVFDTYFQLKYIYGAYWVRLSAQVYLEMQDFEWAAEKLLDLCEGAKKGDWRASGGDAVFASQQEAV